MSRKALNPQNPYAVTHLPELQTHHCEMPATARHAASSPSTCDASKPHVRLNQTLAPYKQVCPDAARRQALKAPDQVLALEGPRTAVDEPGVLGSAGANAKKGRERLCQLVEEEADISELYRRSTSHGL